MRLFNLLLSLLGTTTAVLATNDNYTDVVAWDPYSLMVNGKRVFIYSGEFHYPRLPVPELWMDVLQKFKANGLNAITVYFFWSYHSASRDVFDFTTSGKDIQRLFDMAKEVGMYVIARPGPYINGEANAGGFALWTSDGSGGKLRTSNDTYYQAWLPWVQEIGNILAKNQITEGGPVILNQIENELQETAYSANNTLVLYMEQIEQAFREAGIIIPFSSNEKGERSVSWTTDYQDVGGAVNVYGLDSYPGGFSCTNVNSGFNVLRNYFQWFSNYSFTQPSFLPEFEGGYFTPWGGSFYDQCLEEHDPAFADVYYKNNIGQRVTMQSIYMGYGGTNWGQSAAPVVYTSYDYSAPLRETREVQDKFKQTKLLALFLRVSSDLLETVMESNGTGNAVSSSAIWSWVLRNPDTGAGFYVVQQNNTVSRDPQNFSVYLNTSAGAVTVPNVQLNGRQSKFILTDYRFANETLLYTSAEVLTYGNFDVPVLVFYLQSGQTGEFAFKSASKLDFQLFGTPANLTSSKSTSGNSTFAKYTYTQAKGPSVIKFSNGVLAYLLDLPSAWTFFAPPTTLDPNVGPDQQIFILGPYNVRNASIQDSVVQVSGDNANTTFIEVFTGDSSITQIQWNGILLPTTQTPYGALTAQIPGTENRTVTLPTLTDWKVNNSLPEAQAGYNDANWTICNKTTTLSPVAPLTLPVLFSSDYGFYTGIKLYRGYFSGTNATSANITVQGGLASGWSAWLNGVLVGGNPGNASLSATSALLDFSNATSVEEGNVLTVVTDYTGHDETSTGPAGVENPRGVLGAVLYGPGNATLAFAQWKIQGNAGGSANIDPVRGPMNEGGLYGERLGWHLPGFDTSGWEMGSPMEGLNASGVAWYVTTFELDIDEDLDVPLGIELDAPNGTTARVMIFMNGYQYGKYVPQIGPQTRFPFQPGIVNNHGTNTLAVSLWAQTEEGARLSNATLFAYGKYQTGFNVNQDWSYLQPTWTADRLLYA
ncbi:glycoside hydrolase family 35 protein [Viridothelium virens]|uniref:beta-galactosidase n=1 Tax=Viridothelium virens TaxID=1048519 RepID=A0A6A6H725_VIRVR|nr:glycoside hydrolase family 35 protein [Viridothelium virens]